MAGQLIDEDPQLAHRHALAAKQGAPRLPIVREAVGETAYAAGEYSEALSEFRALRRMTGTDEYLPAMADCERALGRYQAALKLVREGLATLPDAPAQIELRLVEAGIRADSGQLDESVRLLQREIEEIGTRGTKLSRARLRYAYADLLERAGDDQLAEQWFSSASTLDTQGVTDAADRLARLRGVVIEFDESEDDELDEDEPGDDELDDQVDAGEIGDAEPDGPHEAPGSGVLQEPEADEQADQDDDADPTDAEAAVEDE